jgi:flagellar operon protein
MNDRMTVGQLQTARSGPLPNPRIGARPANGSAGIAFRELLDRNTLKFSHHAEQRLEQRGIVLNADQLNRIAGAVDQAAAKGARDSLVLYRNIAMIVNVPNRTVVTAMDESTMDEHVFTQIDSAVVVR